MIFTQEHQIFDRIRQSFEDDLADKDDIDTMIIDYLQGIAYRNYTEEHEGDSEFERPEITDGQIADWWAQHYQQLRREYILSQMPQHEQNEAVVEQADGDDTKMQRLIEVKQRAKELFPK